MKDEKKSEVGLTLELIIGSYGGFYIKYKSHAEGYRICLGWIALTLYLYDMDSFLENVLKAIKKG